MMRLIEDSKLPLSVKLNDNFNQIHCHDELEVIYVLSGNANLLVSNTRYPISEGDLRIINISNIHSIEPVNEGFKHISIFLDMHYFNQFIPNIEFTFFECVPNNNIGGKVEKYIDILFFRFWSIIKIFISEQSTDINSHGKKEIVDHAISLLIELRNWFTLMDKYIDAKSEESDRIWVIADYIYDNYNRKLTLSEVADYVFLTPNYLSHYIKNTSSLSFQELVNFIRSEMALKLLIGTNKSISKISEECGFSEPRYFKKYFKMFYDISPRDYRNEYGFMCLSEQKNIISTFRYKQISNHDKQIIDNHMEKHISGGEYSLLHLNQLYISIDMANRENDTAKISPLCIHVNKHYDLYNPIKQKFFKSAISDLKAEYLYIRDISNIMNEEWQTIYEIAGILNCTIIKEASEEMRHCFLIEDDIFNKSNFSFALYTQNGIKTPQYFLQQLYTMMNPSIIKESADYLITGDSDNIEVLIVNNNDYKINIDIDIKNLQKQPYVKSQIYLDFNHFYNKKNILTDIHQFFNHYQLSVLHEMNRPEIYYEKLEIVSRTYTTNITAPSNSAVLMLLHTSRAEPDRYFKHFP